MSKHTAWFSNRPGTKRAIQTLKKLVAWHFGFRKYRNSTFRPVKTTATISFADATLVCAFVFAYAKFWFSHDPVHLLSFKLAE